MRIFSFLLLVSVFLTMQGCSIWKREQIISYKKFQYDIQEPVRQSLSPHRTRSLKLPSANITEIDSSPNHLQYYSANGNICRVISVDGSEVVCSVAGEWRNSSPIFASHLLR